MIKSQTNSAAGLPSTGVDLHLEVSGPRLREGLTDALREAVVSRWGKQTLVALTMMAMYSRNFPVLKRALGHAKSCQRVRVGGADIAVAQELKAA